METIIQESLSLFPSETEAQIGRRKRDEMVKRDPGRVEELRKAARHFIYQNKSIPIYRVPNMVTADDVRRECGIERIRRALAYWTKETNNMMGSIFLGGNWARLGFVKSTGEGRRGSMISAWTLKEYFETVKPIFDTEYVK